MAHDPLPKLFKAALACSLAAFAALVAIDLSLRNAAAPNGIVSFELCAYAGSCRAILDAWDPTARLMAALSLGLDYLFMVAYPAAICFGLLLLVPRVPASRRVQAAGHLRRAGNCSGLSALPCPSR